MQVQVGASASLRDFHGPPLQTAKSQPHTEAPQAQHLPALFATSCCCKTQRLLGHNGDELHPSPFHACTHHPLPPVTWQASTFPCR